MNSLLIPYLAAWWLWALAWIAIQLPLGMLVGRALRRASAPRQISPTHKRDMQKAPAIHGLPGCRVRFSEAAGAGSSSPVSRLRHPPSSGRFLPDLSRPASKRDGSFSRLSARSPAQKTERIV